MIIKNISRGVVVGVLSVVVFAGGAILPGIRQIYANTTGLAIDGSVSTHQSTPDSLITSGALSTTHSNDLLVAFLASDGPLYGSMSFSSVSGGGLTWRLRERTNAQAGDAEIWEAVAPNPLNNVSVTAVRSSGTYMGSINVVAFSGAGTSADGAVASNNSISGAPTVSMTTARAGSWVWAVGNDWESAIDRTVGSGQTIFDQFLTSANDTYWVQRQNSAGNAANTTVTINDSTPTTDRWDFSAIEVSPAATTTTPTTPIGLIASANSANQVTLNWAASTDSVDVTGYRILRNGTPIATTPTNSYVDTGVSPSTTYDYAVIAYDSAGNASGQSNIATVTTPAASGSGGGQSSGGCTADNVVAPCIGSATTGASGWGTPVFDDEFNGTTLNSQYWSPTWFNGGSINNVTTSASNATVSGGDLILSLGTSSSGATVDTDPSQTNGGGFQFGDGYYAEASIYLPGNGTTINNWPAFWTDGQSWPADGEIDVTEGLGTLTSNYHSNQGASNSGTITGTWANGWHTYAVDREANMNYIYWDGQLVRSYATDDGGAPQYLIFTVGCSGSCNTGAASQVKVDYVRVWKKQ